MQREVTVAVSTHVIGMGSERKTSASELILPERCVSAQTLIAEHVRHEIERVKHSNSTSLALQYLINNPNALNATPTTLDIAHETQLAWDAIRTGQCLLLVDGMMIPNLEAEIALHDNSRVGFMRLMPLIGG